MNEPRPGSVPKTPKFNYEEMRQRLSDFGINLARMQQEYYWGAKLRTGNPLKEKILEILRDVAEKCEDHSILKEVFRTYMENLHEPVLDMLKREHPDAPELLINIVNSDLCGNLVEITKGYMNSPAAKNI